MEDNAGIKKNNSNRFLRYGRSMSYFELSSKINETEEFHNQKPTLHIVLETTS